MQLTVFNRIIFFLIMAMATLVPMAYSNEIVRVFDLSKGATLKIGGTFISLAWFIGIIYFKRFKDVFFNNIFSTLALLFLVMAGLSTAFSLNSWTSFFGVYERQLGYYGLVCAVMMSLILTDVIDREDNSYLEQFLYFVVAAGTIVSLQTVFQEMGFNPLGVIKGKFGYVSGIMGHSNFLGSYIAITTVITLAGVFYFRANKTKVAVFSILGLLQFIVLILARSRGAIAAVVISLVMTLCIWFLIRVIDGKKAYQKQLSIFAISAFNFLYSCLLIVRFEKYIQLGVFLLILAIVFIGFIKFNQRFQILNVRVLSGVFFGTIVLFSILNFEFMSYSGYRPFKKSPGNATQRFYSIFTFSSTTTPRYLLWKDTTKILFKKPFLGMGLENFRTQFMKYKSKKLQDMEPTVNYDNPHNSYLYYFVTLGIFGSLFYFLIFFFLGKSSFKSKEILWIFLFSCFFILYFPAFDTNELITMFWIVVGVHFAYHPIKFKRAVPDMKYVKFIVFAIFLGVTTYATPTLFNYLKADHLMLESMKKMKMKDANSAFSLVDKALELNPHEHFYNLQKVKYFNAILKSIKDPKIQRSVIARARKQIDDSLAYSWAPENAYINLVNSYLAVGDYRSAYQMTEKVLEHSPYLPKVLDLNKKLQKFR